MTPQAMSGSLFGLGVVSSAITGFGKYEQGQQEQAAYNYNAAITLQNMRDRVQATQEKTSTLVGRQASGYAAAGVDIASGSPLLIMAATAARGGEQGEQIEQAGDEQAALERYYGKIAAWSGTMGGIGAFLSGLSSSATAYQTATAKTSPSAGPSLSPVPAGGGEW